MKKFQASMFENICVKQIYNERKEKRLLANSINYERSTDNYPLTQMRT